MDDSVFSAIASCALADSSWPWRSMSLASRSAVSMRASTWPACTASPFADGDRADLARHLRLDGRLADRLQGARHRQPARQRLALGDGQVGRRELERHRRVLVFVAAFLLLLVEARRRRRRQAPPPARTAIAMATRRPVMRTAMECSLLRCWQPSRPAARLSRARPLFGCGARAVWICRTLFSPPTVRQRFAAMSPPYATFGQRCAATKAADAPRTARSDPVRQGAPRALHD